MAATPSPSDAPLSGRHRVAVIGGGSAGISVAARLRRAGVSDITLIEPSDTHWYQPLWTLVGGGQAPLRATRRPESSVIPDGVRWIRRRALAVDPEARTVSLSGDTELTYEHLVTAPGLQLDWDGVPGLAQAVGHDRVSSNYAPEYAPRTWDLIKRMRSGTAVFTHPATPLKCGGAPQKIAYLAADHWRRRKVLDDIRIILVLPDPAMFKVPAWSQVLQQVASRYGIEVRLNSEMTAVDGDAREITVADHAHGTKETVGYDLLHAVPPQSAPDWVKTGPLADPASPQGFVAADKHTLQHPSYDNVFALGDVANLPTSKTGAAVRKQAPVVAGNLLDVMNGRSPSHRYDGYTSCPLVTARDRMLLAEFDYDLTPTPTFPLLDPFKERRTMWLFKRYGLPPIYWHGMLTGRL
ncbi:sulfide:quinone oxidoreductase [Streptomyces sp. SAI-135]|uniref:NAD(P)/FAD-dependent oxidoreductase n=1 Tax=unclassified Streptomyces TaxID=2593676 RepID=UPI0024756442|nr:MULTISPECIES: FAD/NAD(P)-binding oxidoreductase [unclassified Streptomyces]MDH6521613.1 sulfide:quinone oxidoreductase [Streptomyces sp. SAI-090]MDH6614288.1 sulfide:quinone oxidoreductase [Streptomyces sp. SAI-135]